MLKFKATYPTVRAIQWTGRNIASVRKFTNANVTVTSENSLVITGVSFVVFLDEYVVRDDASGIIFAATERELITFYTPMKGSKSINGNRD